MWKTGIQGIIDIIRLKIKIIVMSKYFDNLIMICVLMNTVVLALDGLVD